MPYIFRHLRIDLLTRLRVCFFGVFFSSVFVVVFPSFFSACSCKMFFIFLNQ